jgi:hypothetical protein
LNNEELDTRALDEEFSILKIEQAASDAPIDRMSEDLTHSFVRLTNLPTFPLDRLSRYESALWRQACQIIITLGCSGQRR